MAIDVRLFQPDTDLTRLVELLNAVEQAEGREPSFTSERLEKAFAWPNHYRWIATAPNQPDELVGYSVLFHQTTDRCYGDAKVHPAWRRQGIGRLLIHQLVEKATDLQTRHLAIDVDSANQDALRFLLTQGFRYRGDTWALLAPADAQFLPPAWPAGYSVNSYAQAGDIPMLVEVSNRGFGDMWGHWENTPGLVDAARVTATLEQFDPRGIFLVFNATGAAVGQCRTLAATEIDTPHILDEPGIVPEHRSAGLHAPLVLTAARWLQAQGHRPIQLESWGDSAETVAIYESLGFTLIEHEVSYVRELDR